MSPSKDLATADIRTAHRGENSMKNRKPLFILPVLAMYWLGCASPRLITLADGSKVAPATTYLSAQQMEVKGKNGYGVPDTSFSFYPEKWVPSTTSISGVDKKKWEELSGPNGSRFRPTNMPDWDGSNGDPPSVRHDCFNAERLFLVPWGDGSAEMPVKIGKEKQMIALFYSLSGEIVIWSQASGKAYFLTEAGKVTRVLETSDEALYVMPELQMDSFEAYQIKKIKGALASKDLTIEWDPSVTPHRESHRPWKFTVKDAQGTPLCRLYLPASVPDEDVNYDAWSDFREKSHIPFRVKKDGRIFYPIVSEAGLEIYVYTPN